MRGESRKTGWMIALRRFGAVGAVAFAFVFLVGLSRGEAVALTAGDELCIYMGGNLPPRLPLADPSDPADPSHDCCDLGLCLSASAALPPTTPQVASSARRVLRLRRALRRRAAPPSATRRNALPRGPPAAAGDDAVGHRAVHPVVSRRETCGPVPVRSFPPTSTLASSSR